MKNYLIYKMRYAKVEGVYYRQDLEPVTLVASEQEVKDFFGIDEFNGKSHNFKDIKPAVHTQAGYTVIEA